MSCVVSTYLYGAFDCMFISCHVCVSEWIHTLYLRGGPGTPYRKLAKSNWSLIDCNRPWSHNHLVCKRALGYLVKMAKWLNCWLLLCKLKRCGFESRCDHLSFRYRACFKQGVSWNSGNYRLWIQSEMRTWPDRNIQSFLNGLILLVIWYDPYQQGDCTFIYDL